MSDMKLRSSVFYSCFLRNLMLETRGLGAKNNGTISLVGFHRKQNFRIKTSRHFSVGEEKRKKIYSAHVVTRLCFARARDLWD